MSNNRLDQVIFKTHYTISKDKSLEGQFINPNSEARLHKKIEAIMARYKSKISVSKLAEVLDSKILEAAQWAATTLGDDVEISVSQSTKQETFRKIQIDDMIYCLLDIIKQLQAESGISNEEILQRQRNS